jgi:hypothetical protein
MATTTKFLLTKPVRGSLEWDTPLNGNFDSIDTILYSLRVNYANATAPTQLADIGSFWYDTSIGAVKIKVPTGYHQILTTVVGDARYINPTIQNTFTAQQKFTDTGAIYFNKTASGDSCKIYFPAYQTTKNWLTFLFGDTPSDDRIKFRWSGTDSAYDILDIKSNEIIAYKPLLVPTSSGTSYAINKGYADGAYATAAQGVLATNALPAISFTGAQILSRIITVDGAGSGLDADTVDGVHGSGLEVMSNKGIANGYASLDSSARLPTAQLPLTINATTLNNRTASEDATSSTIPIRTAAGVIEIIDSVYISPVGTSREIVGHSLGTLNVAGMGGTNITKNCNWNGSDWRHFNNGYATKLELTGDNTSNALTLSVSSYGSIGSHVSWTTTNAKVWHEGNDGSGSGLDADTVDGVHGTVLSPVGSIIMHGGSVAPRGWIECDGQSLSRTGDTASLFEVIGTTWGPGNGSTTFNVPDMRGYFPRGWDHGSGVDDGRALGSIQQDAMQNITGSFGIDNITQQETTPTGAFYYDPENVHTPGTGPGGVAEGAYANFDASRVVRTADETRPKNKAVMYIIKY